MRPVPGGQHFLSGFICRIDFPGKVSKGQVVRLKEHGVDETMAQRLVSRNHGDGPRDAVIWIQDVPVIHGGQFRGQMGAGTVA